jgi:hypothetical protein
MHYDTMQSKQTSAVLRHKLADSPLVLLAKQSKTTATHPGRPAKPGTRGYRPRISFSSRSFASLILLAKYGEPPRSGWFASMICRCASLSLLAIVGPSLKTCYRPEQNERKERVLEAEDGDRLSTVHFGFEATLDPLLCGAPRVAQKVPAGESSCESPDSYENGGGHDLWLLLVNCSSRHGCRCSDWLLS